MIVIFLAMLLPVVLLPELVDELVRNHRWRKYRRQLKRYYKEKNKWQ